MPVELVIIAGPQAAGKSTLISQLGEDRHNVICLRESRQIIVRRKNILGGIFMTPEDEEEVVRNDFKRMDLMLMQCESRFHTVYCDECNVFTVAHALAHGVAGAGGFWEEYLERLEALNAKIIFLDVPPEISWLRREQRYRERLVNFSAEKHGDIMSRYREYLENLYPQLLDVYGKLDFPKRRIDATCDVQSVLLKTNEALASISPLFK